MKQADRPSQASVQRPGLLAIALAGAVALAVAMGIGRFAFTPLLPMMLADGVIDLRSASWLASANYLGYLAGALLCTFQPLIWRRMRWRSMVNPAVVVRWGLAATIVLTLGMAAPFAPMWPWLRFAAGVASACVFVFGSAWCLATLTGLGVPEMGGLMYTGPGAGIALSGVFASGMVAWHWRAAAAWAVFGALALGLTALVWRVIVVQPVARGVVASRQPSTPASSVAPAASATEVGWLAIAYGLAGFGYIVTATFLPVIARDALPGSAWIDLFWPTFGIGIVAGALLSTRVHPHLDRRWLLAGCYAVQAAAIGTSVWSPTLAGFAASSLMLGLPFTAITFFAMQEVRHLRPAAAASMMGLLTAMYGVGQIVGPPMVAGLLHVRASRSEGFAISLTIAASALIVGAAIYLTMARVYPNRDVR